MNANKDTRSSPRKSRQWASVVGDISWRHCSAARLMHIAAQRQQERVIAIMVKAGYTKMRLAHINLTRNLDLEGNTITELANRAAMTKQAMGELVDQCERIKIVQRTADPKDRRVWIVKFTDAGLVWLDDLGKAVAQVEGELAGIVGKMALEAMKDSLAAYNRAELPPID